MSLLLGLYRFWREESKRPAANAESRLRFEKWVQGVTTDDIRTLFLATLTEGNEDLHSPVITRAEIRFFDNVVAHLTKSPSGELDLRSLITYLVQAHNEDSKRAAILGATPLLEILIASHAHYPFTTPVALTRDALLRAVLLLTHYCERPFKQACLVGHDYQIREHPDKDRLAFMYSALACPPKGVPVQDDVLAIVSRVEYPWETWGKGIINRQLLDGFKPLAERLEPVDASRLPEPLPVEQLEPLRELIKAFPPRWDDPVVVMRFRGEDALTEKQFVRWARKVRICLEDWEQ